MRKFRSTRAPQLTKETKRRPRLFKDSVATNVFVASKIRPGLTLIFPKNNFVSHTFSGICFFFLLLRPLWNRLNGICGETRLKYKRKRFFILFRRPPTEKKKSTLTSDVLQLQSNSQETVYCVACYTFSTQINIFVFLLHKESYNLAILLYRLHSLAPYVNKLAHKIPMKMGVNYQLKYSFLA